MHPLCLLSMHSLTTIKNECIKEEKFDVTSGYLDEDLKLTSDCNFSSNERASKGIDVKIEFDTLCDLTTETISCPETSIPAFVIKKQQPHTTTNYLLADENDDDDMDDEHCTNASTVLATPDCVRFSDGQLVDMDTVRQAVAFYRDTSSGPRSFSYMNSKFWFLRNHNQDMEKLRQFEQDERSCIDRPNQLRVLNEQLRQVVLDQLNNGLTVHDKHIQLEALKLNQVLRIPRFKASRAWIQKFKKANCLKTHKKMSR